MSVDRVSSGDGIYPARRARQIPEVKFLNGRFFLDRLNHAITLPALRRWLRPHLAASATTFSICRTVKSWTCVRPTRSSFLTTSATYPHDTSSGFSTRLSASCRRRLRSAKQSSKAVIVPLLRSSQQRRTPQSTSRLMNLLPSARRHAWMNSKRPCKAVIASLVGVSGPFSGSREKRFLPYSPRAALWTGAIKCTTLSRTAPCPTFTRAV